MGTVFECPDCNRLFKGNQSRAVHMNNWCPKRKSESNTCTTTSHKKLFGDVPSQNTSDTVECGALIEENTDDQTADPNPVQPSCDTAEPDPNVNVDTPHYDHRRNKRRQYTAQFKMEVLDAQRANTMMNTDLAIRFGISKSQLCDWKRKESTIAAAAATERKKHTKIRKANKHNGLFVKLYEKVSSYRKKGLKVSHKWIHVQAQKLNKDINGDSVKPIGRHIVSRFVSHYNIKIRRKQRSRPKPKQDYTQRIMQFHSTLREALIKTSPDDPNFDPKWGMYPPAKRINVDQSPLPFVVDRGTTYELDVPKENRAEHKVWISQPGSGLDKRQCTLQIAISPGDTKVKLAVIFRGKGKRIGEDERKSWHPDVDVYFQENAWADGPFCLNWIEKTLKPAVTDLDRFVLFCDNLSAQVTPVFKSAVKELGGITWYGVPNATDIWQPVDAGFAQLLKRHVAMEQDQWLCEEENIEKWLETDGKKLSVKERRILITEWVGQAYNRLSGPEFSDYRRRMFSKTGCLITADGSEDSLISPEGLTNYVVPPPLLIRAQAGPASHDAPAPATDEQIPECKESDDDSDVESVGALGDQDEMVDEETERDYEHNLVGRKIKALYDAGWATGRIRYFNSQLGLHVEFNDGSEDYIQTDEIDDTEILLL